MAKSVDNTEQNYNEIAKEAIVKNRSKNRALLIVGIALTALFLVAAIVLMVNLNLVNVLPSDYVVLIGVMLGLLFVIIGITQRWMVPGIIFKVVALLLSIVMIIGSTYLNITYSALKKMSGVTTKKVVIGVYVLEENEAETIEEVEKETFGILKEQDRKNTDETIKDLEKKLDVTLTLAEYDNMLLLADALLAKEVGVMVLNTASVGALEDIEGYEEFSDKIKLLTSVEKEEEIVIDKKEDEQNEDLIHSDDGHVFTMYISGVDIEGSPAENRNSDVNILMTVNKKTHQILLLNTPRDFYVDVQYIYEGSQRDKLTHAGCEGIDCSIATLENFYGIDISSYLKVNFTGFKKIIDALGGVNVWSEYEFTSYHGKYHFDKGFNYMTGAQALGFARERYSFGSGDNQRGRNQMEVIKAVIEKMESSDMLLNYQSVLDSVSSSMITSLTYDQIAELAQFQINEMPKWDIQIYAVSGSGDNQYCYRLGSANYVMWPNMETVDKAKDYMNQLYNDETIKVQ